MSKQEKKREKTSKQEIESYKLKNFQKSVDKQILLWYYT